MKLKKLKIFIVLLAVNSSAFPRAELQITEPKIADWTVFIEVQAKNDLHTFAIENLRDMSRAGSSKKINILIQWHQLGKPGVWRYKVNKDAIELISHTSTDVGNDCVKSVVDGCRWAFKDNYPSKHKAFILWGHASGVGDPSKWWDHNFSAGTKAEEDPIASALEKRHRGILFDWEKKSYMNNQELVNALRQIKNSVLCGKKLDVLGMDACMMAMIEVAYQARDTADYLVTSQEVSPGKGWRYASLFSSIASHTFTPVDFSKYVVVSFEKFYEGKIPWYTQSAIDLNHIDSLRQNIDDVVSSLFTCKKEGGEEVRDAIRRARSSSLEFYSKSYIDLHSFYVELEKEFSKPLFQKFNGLSQLKTNLEFGKRLIGSVVIANAVGSNFDRAKGISIYYPSRIDASYSKTEFAQNGSWINFLRESL